jgi:hypothetical protein
MFPLFFNFGGGRVRQIVRHTAADKVFLIL